MKHGFIPDALILALAPGDRFEAARFLVLGDPDPHHRGYEVLQWTLERHDVGFAWAVRHAPGWKHRPITHYLVVGPVGHGERDRFHEEVRVRRGWRET